VSLLFLLLVLTVYANPLFFRRNFAGRDLAVYNFPMEKAMHDAYARHRLPLWMAEVSGGRPLLPNPNAGALYPVRPLFSVLPFPLAMRLFPVVHWIAAGIGVVVLLRSLGATPAASWVGAVTYVFSGVGVAEVFFPNLHPGMALLPWIVWASARSFARPSTKLFLLSLLYGVDFLAGDVFTIGMAIASSALWIVLETDERKHSTELLLLSGALALAALLAAPQILATALWIPATNRGVVGMKLFESLFFSVHPLRLLELVVPFPFGANWTLERSEVWGSPVFRGRALGMFTTLYAGAFASIALVLSRKARGVGFRFARVLFIGSLVVAVLPSLIPSAWEKFASPLPLRNPEKFSVAIVFALAILAGLTFDRLRESPSSSRWPLLVGASIAAVAAACALFPGPAGRVAVWLTGGQALKVSVASRKLPGTLAEGGLLWVATLGAIDLLRRRSRPTLGVSLLILTAVPIAANRKIARALNEEEIFSPTAFARLLQRADPHNAYRTLGESTFQGPSDLLERYAESSGGYTDSQRRMWDWHLSALWGRGTVFNLDSDSGDFARMQSLRLISVAAAGYTDSSPFFGSLALRWGIRARDQRPLSGYRRFGGDWLQDWDVLEDARPAIRLASAWIEESGALSAVGSLGRLKAGEIVLETGRRARGSSGGGIVHVFADDPEHLSVETVTSDPSWLFVLRGFWSYRTVLVDRRPVECVPAQIAFSAVPLPTGRHRIEWNEALPGAPVSRWGPVVYAVGLAVLWIRDRQRIVA
jgi:hypothetical protein